MTVDQIESPAGRDALATLQGIATFTASARDHFAAAADPELLDVLRVVESHARNALAPFDRPTPAPAVSAGRLELGPARVARAGRSGRPAAPGGITVAEAVDWLVGDAPALVEHMPVVAVLGRVRELGPEGARSLLHRHRVVGEAQLRAVPLQKALALAGELIEMQGAPA